MSGFEKLILRKRNMWIHILVGLLTYGVSVLIYLVVYFKNKDYFDMTRNPEIYAEKNNLRCFHSKIVGVTYNNDNGTSRQKYLSSVKQFDELNLRIYEYKPGEKAVGVFYNNNQLGNINADLVDEIMDYMKHDQLISIIATPTGSEGKTRGCNITILTDK